MADNRNRKITWPFRKENWPCRKAVLGLKISLEPRQKVVVSGGSMPQQRQRGSSQQTSSSSRTIAYIQPYTPPYPPIHPIAIPIPTIFSSPSPSTLIPLSRSTPLPPGSEGVLVVLHPLPPFYPRSFPSCFSTPLPTPFPRIVRPWAL